MASRRFEYPAAPSAGLRFLYENPAGRAVLALISGRTVSRAVGAYMSSPLSRRHIAPFIAANGIDMGEYPARRYRDFNDFFTREIKPDARPVDPDPRALVAPCDSRLSVYDIEPGAIFKIKNTRYSVAAMLGDGAAARAYTGGLCLVFRLAVDNYHRVCFFDGGMKYPSRFIPGRLHTVQPIAAESGFDIYARNCRSVSYIETDGFGRAAMIYVGALLVGRIEERYPRSRRVSRGEEAGLFRFGGSTVVLLLPPGAASVDPDIRAASDRGEETLVKYGEKIGEAPSAQ